MFKNLIKRRFNETEAFFGGGTRFEGKLAFEKSLKISGYYLGEISSSGMLYIDKGATVEAKVKAKTIIVAGKINGSIIATDQVVLLSGAAVDGVITAGKVKIDDNVDFRGRCKMLTLSKEPDIFAVSCEELKIELQESVEFAKG